MDGWLLYSKGILPTKKDNLLCENLVQNLRQTLHKLLIILHSKPTPK